MSLPAKEKEYYMDSDGTMVHYPQVYQLTPEQIEKGTTLIQYIKDQQDNIQRSFLKMGAALLVIENEELFKVDGLPTFKSWLDSGAAGMSYFHATRLMRIVKDLVPILGEENLPPVSTMKELLPLLNEGATEEEIKEIFEEVRDLTTADAKKVIRERRGLEDPTPQVLFHAKVSTTGDWSTIHVRRSGGDDADL